MQLAAYELAVSGISDEAIQRTAAMFIRGEIKDHDPKWLPTSAHFAKECRDNERWMEAAKNRKPALAPPQEPEQRFSEDHRQSMIIKLDLLSRALRGERAAQKALVPYGWKLDRK